MRGTTIAAVVIWLVAAAILAAVLVFHWPLALHAYLVAWLVLVSLPLGALPILMALSLTRETLEISGALRLLLAGLPFLAILGLPVLLMPGLFYGWVPGSHLAAVSAGSYSGFAARWFTPFFFAARGIAFLVVWVVLAIVFMIPGRPSPMRRALAGLGLLVHLLIGTLAAYDWFMSLDPSFVSSDYGVVVIGAQIAAAAATALTMTRPSGRAAQIEGVVLLVLVAIAAYLQFAQYLVVWSANLPKEIVWYQTRWRDVAGPALVYGAPVLLLLATAALVPPWFLARRTGLLTVFGAIVFVGVVDLVCLASPGATFTVPLVLLDGACVVVVAGLAGLVARVLDGFINRRSHHVRA